MNAAVTGSSRVSGVFGWPVSHSLSPAMHNAAFRDLELDYIYVPFEVHPDNLEAAVRGAVAMGLVGFNLTIPHKETVIAYLDSVEEKAERIGSVNTIATAGGRLLGSSTDGEGFLGALLSAGFSPSGCRAVILGAGGSAKATADALLEAGADVTIANRSYNRALDLAVALGAYYGGDRVSAVSLDGCEAERAVGNADLLTNCTSVGMYPQIDSQPVPESWLHSGLFVYDQIYNPLETRLLKSARRAGARTSNGVGMLARQGARSSELWTGVSPSIEVMERAVVEGLESPAKLIDGEVESMQKK